MKSLLHPVLRIVGVAVAVALALRALFFYKAQWLWAQYVPAAPLSLTPWTRWAAKEHDGITVRVAFHGRGGQWRDGRHFPAD